MTPQELKNSILQLAIQGKLVEQRPEEGTAEELSREIQKEKQALIKAGKIKKEKPLPEIAEEELPFEIPETWKWVRLRNIVFNRGQETPEEEFCYIDIGSIDNKRQSLNETETLVAPENAPSRARKLVKYGDILYSTVRPYLHNMCIIDRTFSHKPIASTGFAAMVCYTGINNRFLLYYLMSPSFDQYANNTENAKGVAYPAINDDRLYRALIALPPFAEQKRIVSKIEELLPLIDRYEKAWTRLEDFNKRFPSDMQKSILQMAIQGKLVEQRPEEGTGEELYQQIQKEKLALIKAGKTKKEKPLPEIAEDELPFDIPETWKWVRIGDAFTTSSGTTPLSSNTAYYLDGEINWVRTTDLNNGILRSCEVKITKKAVNECKLDFIPRSSVCIAMYGGAGTIGKNALIEFDTTINQSVCAIHPNNYCNMKYLLFYMQFLRPRWMEYASGTRKDPNINKVIIKKAVFPLPPLAEQKRIVARLEELLPLCEKLK